MSTTMTLTAAELAGLEQFKAAMAQATPFQREMGMQGLLPGGSAERMTGAPRREVLDEMVRILRAFGVK